MSPLPAETRSRPPLAADTLWIDVNTREAERDGRRLELTPKEFDLLAFLAARPGRTFSRAQLLQEVWASSAQWQGAATVTEHVYRLRGKLRRNGDRPELVLTVKGAGYRFEPPDHGVDRPVASRLSRHNAVVLVVDGTIRFASRAARDLMAPADPVDVVGREFLDYVGASSTDAVAAGVTSAEEGHWPRPELISIRRVDGSEVTVEMASMPGQWDGRHATQIMMWSPPRDHADEDPPNVPPAVDDRAFSRLVLDLRSPVPRRCSTGERISADPGSRRDPRTAGGEGPRTAERINELRTAMSRGELHVHYQPIVELDKADWVGAEALMRWQHPTRGLLRPEEFLPLAEQSGVIVDLGQHLLLSACLHAQGWRDAGHDLHLSVNISARQLADGRLPERVAAVIAATAMPAGHLWLEVTETDLVEDVAQAQVVLREIDDLGARISIDDFGTGWASLTYAHDFPIRQLKIDRSFVQALGHSWSAPAIVRSVISLGRDLGLDVIAEGIETEEQRARLLRLGCRLGQGFLFGHPQPAGDFDLGLAARHRAGPAPNR